MYEGGVCVCLQVQDRSADADRALREADKTHERAKDLNSEVDELHKRIEGEEQHHSSIVVSTFFIDFLMMTENSLRIRDVAFLKICCKSWRTRAPRCPAKTWRRCSEMLRAW